MLVQTNMRKGEGAWARQSALDMPKFGMGIQGGGRAGMGVNGCLQLKTVVKVKKWRYGSGPRPYLYQCTNGWMGVTVAWLEPLWQT